MRKFAWYVELKQKGRVFYYESSFCAYIGDLRHIELKMRIFYWQQDFTEKDPFG